MARWPDVPDVYGWLSLTERGQWRLHPRADALREPASAGEPISSAQIVQFIDRNYACDEHGRWFFQNGPQRVYARLDAAPYILSTADPGQGLRTHNGLQAGPVAGWWLDDGGRLYARCACGPGLIAGRDAASVMEGLYTLQGQTLLDALEQRGGTEPLRLRPWAGETPHAAGAPATSEPAVALHQCPAQAIPQAMGFQRLPGPGARGG